MQIKVIINNGNVEAVLADEQAKDVDIEIVDINKDHENREAAQEYANEMYADPELQDISFTIIGN